MEMVDQSLSYPKMRSTLFPGFSTPRPSSLVSRGGKIGDPGNKVDMCWDFGPFHIIPEFGLSQWQTYYFFFL